MPQPGAKTDKSSTRSCAIRVPHKAEGESPAIADGSPRAPRIREPGDPASDRPGLQYLLGLTAVSALGQSAGTNGRKQFSTKASRKLVFLLQKSPETSGSSPASGGQSHGVSRGRPQARRGAPGGARGARGPPEVAAALAGTAREDPPHPHVLAAFAGPPLPAAHL